MEDPTLPLRREIARLHEANVQLLSEVDSLRDQLRTERGLRVYAEASAEALRRERDSAEAKLAAIRRDAPWLFGE